MRNTTAVRSQESGVRSHTLYHLLFWILSVSFLSSDTKAEEGLQSIINKVQARYEGTGDIKADFQQTTLFKGFSTPVVYKGRIYIKKPGSLRWDYTEPSKQQIYVDNEKVTYYIPEHKQAIVGLLSEDIESQTPTRLLSGTARLDQDFDVQFEEEKGGSGRPLLRLAPKDPKAGLVKIIIELEPKSYFITKISLFEKNGNSSTFNFTKIEANTGIKDDLFVFTPPKDVEVVEPRPFK